MADLLAIPQRMQFLSDNTNDPFDGEQLRYRKLDVGFVVYSIGEDGHDNGGKERPPGKRRKNGSSTYDITFKIER